MIGRHVLGVDVESMVRGRCEGVFLVGRMEVMGGSGAQVQRGRADRGDGGSGDGVDVGHGGDVRSRCWRGREHGGGCERREACGVVDGGDDVRRGGCVGCGSAERGEDGRGQLELGGGGLWDEQVMWGGGGCERG